MSSPRPLQLGSVVWAELEDANGYRKTRPAAGDVQQVVGIVSPAVIAELLARISGGASPVPAAPAAATRDPMVKAPPAADTHGESGGATA